MDGSLSFSINAHRELCAIQKPGEVAVTPALILKGYSTPSLLQLYSTSSPTLPYLYYDPTQPNPTLLHSI